MTKPHILFILLIIPFAAKAAVISDTHFTSGGASDSAFVMLQRSPDLNDDCCNGLLFQYTNSFGQYSYLGEARTGYHSILTDILPTLDYFSAYYLLPYATKLNNDLITSGLYTPLARDFGIVDPSPVYVPHNPDPSTLPPAFIDESFYIGVALDLGDDGTYDTFGWIELLSKESDIIFVSSAVAYSEPGIIVGTTIVPVPAAVWLFSSGLLGLMGLARKGMML